ncbi:23S rRNA (guanine(745)-N(1))-methyltransferase [Vibrio mangrovi]|uniref:23S rRNA (Guanine(745)-N(1))-methyltransferase n=1 Tax=Vibrio mangrovi TaxID=474394 RepID=A0A1Y6IPM0_9VIBR|nr:23S rRNA (guanine(745)-N(1))-methyltransferase [Vibrio mangrovi]MDW6003599.1 23S rRNA (guanine(745)-N(1))-methyltransferase [Vibrio mangrovi]SMR99609.1 23S rRNA (guanine(745)-N(1))-methyltransferase [Vibrio mangrovi]
MSYQCPLCDTPLQKESGSFRCTNHHQFDIAKEGYVNLMPVQHKRSKDPGDNKEMMQARRHFLEQGYYAAMRNRVAQICTQFIAQPASLLLDIGCGEGYYTTHVAETLHTNAPDLHVYGLDVSKPAIRYAAKRYPNCRFCIASSHRLPFAKQSVDAILRIYAPCKAEELQRCLKTDGILVTVTPAARHLYQLKELIYQEVRLHDEQAESIEGFVPVHEEQLHYPMQMNGTDACNLLQMTPFAWRASDTVKTTLQQQDQFHCEADFLLRVYRRI